MIVRSFVISRKRFKGNSKFYLFAPKTIKPPNLVAPVLIEASPKPARRPCNPYTTEQWAIGGTETGTGSEIETTGIVSGTGTSTMTGNETGIESGTGTGTVKTGAKGRTRQTELVLATLGLGLAPRTTTDRVLDPRTGTVGEATTVPRLRTNRGSVASTGMKMASVLPLSFRSGSDVEKIQVKA
ncbi:hypothetical protein Ccrd_009775 [Cynara cardunculus var. scolymus]|uniref:Uncharacterized protein n=1 Tax=Cynara cardunculus var. scolymus TaxID=59895 RepID=A0A103YMM6_CYNCS|nr:hypothetical protein Ccrd_009775 [Cynara cardunculus var. scolymus]